MVKKLLSRIYMLIYYDNHKIIITNRRLNISESSNIFNDLYKLIISSSAIDYKMRILVQRVF